MGAFAIPDAVLGEVQLRGVRPRPLLQEVMNLRGLHKGEQDIQDDAFRRCRNRFREILRKEVFAHGGKVLNEVLLFPLVGKRFCGKFVFRFARMPYNRGVITLTPLRMTAGTETATAVATAKYVGYA